MQNMSVAPNILDYHQPTPVRPRWRRLLFLLALLHVPIAVVPFLPFVYEIGPLLAVRGFGADPFIHWPDDCIILMLALPFFLIFPLAYLRIRRQFGRPRLLECCMVVLCGLAAVACELSVDVIMVRDRGSIGDMWPAAVNIAILIPGAGWLVWQIHRRTSIAVLAQTTASIAFLANALFCLVIFGNEQINVGYWLTIYACVVLAADLGMDIILRRTSYG